MEKHMQEMRERSGSVRSTDLLVSFLYELLRDHITPGSVEGVMLNTESAKGNTVLFTNGWLAEYAKDLANRLTTGENEMWEKVKKFFRQGRSDAELMAHISHFCTPHELTKEYKAYLCQVDAEMVKDCGGYFELECPKCKVMITHYRYVTPDHD